MKVTEIEAGKLIINEKLTYLRRINPIFVSRYRQAYRNGANMPPLIVNKANNNVVSGNHRLTGFLQEFGPKKKIKIIFKEYKDEKEMLIEFAKENSIHGHPLYDFSRSMIINALLEAGVPEQEVSQIFHVTINRLEKIGDRLIPVIGKDGTKRYMPVKKGLEKVGTLTEDEYEEHKKRDRLIECPSIDLFSPDWFIYRCLKDYLSNRHFYRAIRNFIEMHD